MKLIRKKEFIVAAFDLEDMIFVIYVAFLTIYKDVYTSYKAQIAPLKANEAPTTIPPEYFNFVDVFFPELAIELVEHKKINKHVINLIDGKQLPYKLIYSLGQVELETLKMYIETNLANGFIKPWKSFPSALVFFVWSPMAVFAYILIIEVLIIWLLKIGICCLWLVNPWLARFG